jgi:RNA polymerase sigma-70 factor (ECF subfamily)
VVAVLVDMLRAAGCDAPDELEDALAARLAQARAAWPGVELATERYLAALAEPMRTGLTLDELATDDVYLARACAEGIPAAVAAFDRQCGATVDRAVATSGATPAERADLAQVVRARLLVAPAGGGPPRIATYEGKGSLASWTRVVATRAAADMLPKARRESSADDDDLARLIAPDDDPEIGYLKRLYRGEFKRAFEAALAALPDRDRLVLRQHTLDGLGIDQLAKLHAIHRSTAARWIEGAREALQQGTQRELMQRLQLTTTELTSVVRLIRSQLDVSLPRLLR